MLERPNDKVIADVMINSLNTQEAILEILGMPVSLSDIKTIRKKAYRACHPDKNPDNPAATAAFQKMTEAINKLFTENKNATFDEDHDPNDTIANRVTLINISRGIFLYTAGFSIDAKVDAGMRDQLLLNISGRLDFAMDCSSTDSRLYGDLVKLPKEHIELLKDYAKAIFPAGPQWGGLVAGDKNITAESSQSDEKIAAGFKWAILKSSYDGLNRLRLRFPKIIKESPESEFRKLRIRLIMKCRNILINAAKCEDEFMDSIKKVIKVVFKNLNSSYDPCDVQQDYIKLIECGALLFPNEQYFDIDEIADSCTLDQIKSVDKFLAVCKAKYEKVFFIEQHKIDVISGLRDMMLELAYCKSSKEHKAIPRALSRLNRTKLIDYNPQQLGLESCYKFLFETCEGENPEFIPNDMWDKLSQGHVLLSKIMPGLPRLPEIMDLIKTIREFMLDMVPGCDSDRDKFIEWNMAVNNMDYLDNVDYDEKIKLRACYDLLYSTPRQPDLNIARDCDIAELRSSFDRLNKLKAKRSKKIDLVNKIRSILLAMAKCTDPHDSAKILAEILVFSKDVFYKKHIEGLEKVRLDACCEAVFQDNHAEPEPAENMASNFALHNLEKYFKLVETVVDKLAKIPAPVPTPTPAPVPTPAPSLTLQSSSSHGLFTLQKITPISRQYDFAAKSGLHIIYNTEKDALLVYKQLPLDCEHFIKQQGNKIYIEQSTDLTSMHGVYNNQQKEIVINFPNDKRNQCIVLLGLSGEGIPSKTYSDMPTKIFFPVSMQGEGKFISPLAKTKTAAPIIKYQFDFINSSTSCFYVNFGASESAMLAYNKMSPACQKMMSWDEKTIIIKRSTKTSGGHGVYFNDQTSGIVINFPLRNDTLACIDLLGLGKIPHFLDHKQPTKLYISAVANNKAVTQFKPEHQPTIGQYKQHKM